MANKTDTEPFYNNFYNHSIFNFSKKNSYSRKSLAALKRRFALKTGIFPKNSQLLASYRQLLKAKKVVKNPRLENLLRLKKVRSLSGIVPIAVFTKPFSCPGKCVYCPTQSNIPKSYLKDEPAVMRARRFNFDPYLQTKKRVEQLQATGHSVEKIELIVMGGTFTVLPKNYQKNFIKNCFEAANGSRSKTLAHAQKINEKAKKRIIGITFETRPDEINVIEIKNLLLLGATRIEIGVQSTYDSVLKRIKRGHWVKETIKATKLLKDAGLKICYHLMPNLPGSNLKKDLIMFKNIFCQPEFMPDMIKIYPCVVTYQAQLYEWYKKGLFKPYTNGQLINLLIKIKKIVPLWIRINRLGRDIPIANIAAGNKISNIRQVLQAKMLTKKIKCSCIRCREVKQKILNLDNLKFKSINYQASGGKEYFLEFVDKDNNLFTLLRLRIPSHIYEKKKHFIPILQHASIVREVHTFGFSIPLKSKLKNASQHQGLGKKLIKVAEKLTKKEGLKKIAIIAGVGVRQYYQKLGYQLKDGYMIKKL